MIKGKSQREAFRIAYPRSVNWKETSVDCNASKLLSNAKVSQRYNALHDRLIKEAEDECIVTAKEVLRELKRIGFADIKDFLSYKTAKTVVGYDDDTYEPITEYRQVVDLRDSDEVDGKAIQEVSLNSRGVFTFKLHDKMAALDKLGKYLGMFTDKVEISGQVNNPMEGLTTDELKKLIYDG